MSFPDLWIGTSWKMNKTLAEASDYATKLRSDCEGPTGIQRFVIPPFTMVREVSAILADTTVKLGVQNMHWEDQGAWTGEVSPLMVLDCNAEIVEIGHSERRAHFGETDETVGLKAAAAVRHGLTPLICIGETLAEREAGLAKSVLEHQVRAALGRIPAPQKANPILLAYEPVWAIGDGGMPASVDYANARQTEIAEVAKDVLGRPIPVLYGGSVNTSNCQELVDAPSINGLFIGRAAWDVDGYLEILALCAETLRRAA